MSVIIDMFNFTNNNYYVKCPSCHKKVIVCNDYRYLKCDECNTIFNILFDDLKYYYNFSYDKDKNDFHKNVLHLNV